MKKLRIRHILLAHFLIAFAAFCWYIFRNNGVLMLCNDYNQQEIEFNIFANNAIRQGNVLFNWQIDIGSEFIPSFGFYLLGSPFFWITLPFPARLFPYLAIWIYMLKYTVAGLTSYIYLKQFVKDSRFAFAGSVLYAFSGFQACNLIFYHFHDVVALFPLLLYGADRKMQGGKHGIFALCTAVNALVNWNFFFGETLFAILYYLCRRFIGTSGYGQIRKASDTAREILSFLLEGLLGFSISAVISLPSVLSVVHNGRLSNHMALRDLLHFPLTDYLLMLRGFLMPAEPMTNPSTLVENNFYSIAAWLPLCGCSALPAFFRIKDVSHRWLKVLLSILAVIAVIPALNGVFMLFNAEPYRRWYYMLVLMLCVATVMVLERAFADAAVRTQLLRDIRYVLAATVLFALLISILPSADAPGGRALIAPRSFLLSLAGTAICLLYFRFTLRMADRYTVSRVPLRLLIGGICVSAAVSTFSTLIRYSMQCDWDGLAGLHTGVDEIVTSLDGLEKDILPYRYTVFNPYFNRGMAEGLPTTNSFLSTVDGGIFTFYEALNVPRRVIALDTPEGTELLLGSRYYITKFEPEDEAMHPVQTYDYRYGTICLYEREDYLPVAYPYTGYMTRHEFDAIPDEDKAMAMLHALVIPDADEDAAKGTLHHVDPNVRYNTALMREDIKSHGTSLPHDFHFSTAGVSFTVDCPEDAYIFVSVPYSDRWKAVVNGIPLSDKILNINGLTAFPVKAGQNHAELRFDPTVEWMGLIITLAGALLLILLLSFPNFLRRRRRKLQPPGH